MAKNGHQAKAIDFAKSSLWLKIYKCIKTCSNRFYNTLQLFYAKNGKKQLILEKREHFENGQKWPQAKALDFAKSSRWLKNYKCIKTC